MASREERASEHQSGAPFLVRPEAERPFVSSTPQPERRASSIGAFCLTIAPSPTWPVPTMHKAKTQIIRQPEGDRRLLSSISYHRHHRSAAWIHPIVLGTILVSRNDIGVPVGLRGWRRDDDDPPGLRMDGSNERSRTTQRQGRAKSERDGQYPHASAPCRPAFSPPSIGLWHHLAMTGKPFPKVKKRNAARRSRSNAAPWRTRFSRRQD